MEKVLQWINYIFYFKIESHLSFSIQVFAKKAKMTGLEKRQILFLLYVMSIF